MLDIFYVVLAGIIGITVIGAIVIGALDCLRRGPLAIFRAPPRGDLEDIFGHWTEQDWADVEANLDKEDRDGHPS